MFDNLYSGNFNKINQSQYDDKVKKLKELIKIKNDLSIKLSEQQNLNNQLEKDLTVRNL